MGGFARAWKTAALGLATVVVVLAVITWAFGYFVLGAFHDNKAQDAAAPITRELEALGAHRLCEYGDAGYGPDNRSPWYVAYYLVPDEVAARTRILAAAASSGHPLRLDAAEYQTSKERAYTSTASDDDGLNLTITQHKTLTSQCWGDGGYRRFSTAGKGAIVDFTYYGMER